MMLNLSAEGMSSEVIAPFRFTWDRDNLEKAKQYSFDLNVSICTTRRLGNLPRDRIDIPEKDMRKTHRSVSAWTRWDERETVLSLVVNKISYLV